MQENTTYFINNKQQIANEWARDCTGKKSQVFKNCLYTQYTNTHHTNTGLKTPTTLLIHKT